MKKAKSLFVLAASAFILAGCGPTSNEKSETGSSVTPKPATSETKTSSNEPTPTPEPQPSSSEEPKPAKATDVFDLIDNEIITGGSGLAQVGKFTVYGGDGGSVENKAYDTATSTLKVDFKNTWGATAHAWDVQVFYKAPYAKAGNQYDIKMKVTSTVTGEMTINNQVLAVTANQEASFEMTDWTIGANELDTTICVLFGSTAKGLLASGSVSIKDVQVIDKTNDYHTLTFKNGEETVRTEKVLSGNKAWFVPTIATPEGKVFKGWFIGENKVDPAEVVVSADTTIEAKFIDRSEATIYQVKYCLGDKELASDDVIDGEMAKGKEFGYNEVGFGYKVAGWYSDKELTTKYDFSTPVTAALTLYAKVEVTPTDTYNWGQAFPAEALTHGEDGSLIYTENVAKGGDNWGKQINFSGIPAGEAGKKYALSLDYKMSAAGGDVQIFDNVNVGGVKTLEVTSEWKNISIEFDGGTLTAANKLTFELGCVDGERKLEIGNMKLAEKGSSTTDPTPEPEPEPNPDPSTQTAFPFDYLDATHSEGAGVFVWVKPSLFGEGLTGANFAGILNKAVANKKLTATYTGDGNFQVKDIVPQQWGAKGEDSLCLYIILSGAPVNNFKWTLTFSYTNAVSNFKGSLAFKGSKLAKDIEISADKNAIDIGDTLALTATSETELSEVTWAVAPEDVASLVSEGTSATLTALKAGTATVTVTAKLGEKTVTDSYAVTVRAKATSTEALPIVANEGQTRVDGAQAWIYIDNSQIGIAQEEAATLDWEYTIKGVSHDEDSKPFDSETGTAKITPVGKHVEGAVTESLVCLYVNFNIGINPKWDFDLIFTITLNHGGKQYVGSAKFNKNVYVAPTTAE